MIILKESICIYGNSILQSLFFVCILSFIPLEALNVEALEAIEL